MLLRQQAVRDACPWLEESLAKARTCSLGCLTTVVVCGLMCRETSAIEHLHLHRPPAHESPDWQYPEFLHLVIVGT
jgi:hypothetical protein